MLAIPDEFSSWLMMWSVVTSAAVKSDDEGEDTYKLLRTYTIHWLNACFHGVHPPKDPWGQKWPSGSADLAAARTGNSQAFGGYRFVAWVIVADLEYLCSDLVYPHHGSNYPCWFCSACRIEGTETPLADLSREAAWRSTTVSCEEGIDIACTAHPISQLHGYTRFRTPGELMHTGYVGSVLLVHGS